MIRNLAIGLWMTVGALAMTGCAYIDAGGGGGGGGSKDVYVYDGPGGPPPWAPAHGYRRKTAYRYYPDSDVYYNVQKKEYVYVDGGKWKHGHKPKHLHGDYVVLDIDGDEPEHYHHLVKPHYHHKSEIHHDTTVHHDVDVHHNKDVHHDTDVHHNTDVHKNTDPHHDDHEKHVDTSKDGKGKGKDDKDKDKKKKK